MWLKVPQQENSMYADTFLLMCLCPDKLKLSLSHSLRLTLPYEQLASIKSWSVRPAWPWDPTIFI